MSHWGTPHPSVDRKKGPKPSSVQARGLALSRVGPFGHQQGRSSFEGTEKHFIWLDEEPPMDIYGECLIRTMDTKLGTTNGSIVLTFTPLEGMSTVVLSFMPAEMRPAM